VYISWAVGGSTVDKMENGDRKMSSSSVGGGGGGDKDAAEKLAASNYKVLTQAFTLTFLAEWGDRSQIATIALAAAKDPVGGE